MSLKRTSKLDAAPVNESAYKMFPCVMQFASLTGQDERISYNFSIYFQHATHSSYAANSLFWCSWRSCDCCCCCCCCAIMKTGAKNDFDCSLILCCCFFSFSCTSAAVDAAAAGAKGGRGGSERTGATCLQNPTRHNG